MLFVDLKRLFYIPYVHVKFPDFKEGDSPLHKGGEILKTQKLLNIFII